MKKPKSKKNTASFSSLTQMKPLQKSLMSTIKSLTSSLTKSLKNTSQSFSEKPSPLMLAVTEVGRFSRVRIITFHPSRVGVIFGVHRTTTLAQTLHAITAHISLHLTPVQFSRANITGATVTMFLLTTAVGYLLFTPICHRTLYRLASTYRQVSLLVTAD